MGPKQIISTVLIMTLWILGKRQIISPEVWLILTVIVGAWFFLPFNEKGKEKEKRDDSDEIKVGDMTDRGRIIKIIKVDTTCSCDVIYETESFQLYFQGQVKKIPPKIIQQMPETITEDELAKVVEQSIDCEVWTHYEHARNIVEELDKIGFIIVRKPPTIDEQMAYREGFI